MRTYQRAWCAFWSAVAAVGFGLAVLESSAIGALLALGLLVVICWLGRQALLTLRPGWSSLTLALGMLTVWSFCWVSPSLGLLVVMAAALSSPTALGRAIGSARRSTRAHPAGRAADATRQMTQPGVDADVLTLPEAMGPLRGLDDWQLCRLWRDSFWVMRESASPARVLRLVAVREACLDELERRDAVALHAWLDSGARASSGPEKYLARLPPRRGS